MSFTTLSQINRRIVPVLANGKIFFCRIKTRNLIFISSTGQNDHFKGLICLPTFYVVINNAFEGGPPSLYFKEITIDPCMR